MTFRPAAVPRRSSWERHCIASRTFPRLRMRSSAPVPNPVEARSLAEVSYHLLHDIGLVREPAARTCSSFPSL